MWNPFKKTAKSLSKKTSNILDTFNRTLDSLTKVQEEISKRNDELTNEILERVNEQTELKIISERNSKITSNFKKLIEA